MYAKVIKEIKEIEKEKEKRRKKNYKRTPGKPLGPAPVSARGPSSFLPEPVPLPFSLPVDRPDPPVRPVSLLWHEIPAATVSSPQ
jgi:hypothetical protein